MLKICLVFWESEPQYAYKCYAYKKKYVIPVNPWLIPKIETSYPNNIYHALLASCKNVWPDSEKMFPHWNLVPHNIQIETVCFLIEHYFHAKNMEKAN